MAEELWTNAEHPLPTAEGPQWASVLLEEPPERLACNPTASPTVFFLWSQVGNPEASFRDVTTGESVPSTGQDVLSLPEELPDGLPLTVPTFEARSWHANGPRGSPEGPYLTTIEVELYDLGPILRHVWYDGQQWWLVGDGCVQEDTEPFIVGDGIFTFRPDGLRLGWGPVAP